MNGVQQEGRPRWPAAAGVPIRPVSNNGERPILSVRETAELLGISRWLVQQAVQRGELPVLRVGRRVLIPRAQLLALLAGESAAGSSAAG